MTITIKKPPHPGFILAEHYLIPKVKPIDEAAKDLGVSLHNLSLLVAGKTRCGYDMAARLALYTGTTPCFWLKLQLELDLHRAKTVALQIDPLTVVLI